METSTSIASGLAGATALTLLHESIRRVDPDAPRMDLLGMNALSNILKSMHTKPPTSNKLYWITMAGDMVSNSVYYSAVGIGDKKNVWLRGAFLGLSAGIGAVLLPKPLGLNESYSNRTTETKVLTVGLYLFGGLLTAAVCTLLAKKK